MFLESSPRDLFTVPTDESFELTESLDFYFLRAWIIPSILWFSLVRLVSPPPATLSREDYLIP